MRFTGPFHLEDVTEREWLVTNGLGGYASATLCGMNTRRYHGLLVAALRPPGQRTLLVAKLEETITDAAGQEYLLATNQYPGTLYPQGYHYLTEFELDGNSAIARFTAGTLALEKRVVMVAGENTTLLRYRNTGVEALTLTLTPLVNARDFHGEMAANGVFFQLAFEQHKRGPCVHVWTDWLPDGFWLSADGGTWQEQTAWNNDMTYSWEQRRGLTALDNHFSPGHFTLALLPGGSVTITLSTLPPAERPTLAPAVTVAEEDYVPADEPLEIQQLFRTAHSFLVRRGKVNNEEVTHGKTIIAGYHWFGDWGRDTMIALPGLCLTTRRFADAADILRTFAAARRHGLLPNLFLDSGQGEAYNAVDASLWFIYAVDCYQRATGDFALVQELQPALEEIIQCYREGTDFGIHMDRDGLIVAAAPGWQLTWMDAKVDDWVVTPRMGKPVEISALWYNALRVMENYAIQFRWPGDYGDLAERVRKHFAAFWNPRAGCLYDVLGETPDEHVRPNQIFAVSLPHSPLDLHQARGVVSTVERYLLTPYGLRTLAPQDSDYIGQYRGNQWERDGAYHRGTVWAWLMGPYVEAYLRVHGHTPAAKSLCRTLLKPLLAHTWDAGVGSISEIFEGNPPHLPCGTISQAWSVAEIIRVWDQCRL